jgi:hypothetical protein
MRTQSTKLFGLISSSNCAVQATFQARLTSTPNRVNNMLREMKMRRHAKPQRRSSTNSLWLSREQP